MIDLKEKMEVLTKQYSQIIQQLNDSVTIKTKLEGAMEMTQQLMAEEKTLQDGAIEDKEEAQKVVKKVK